MTKQHSAELMDLRKQLDSLYSEMPKSFRELDQRNKSAFLVSREIEKLENPKAYKENAAHWDAHELRF